MKLSYLSIMILLNDHLNKVNWEDTQINDH